MKGDKFTRFPASFLSNIDAKYKAVALQAAYETGYDIFIKEDATTRDGQPLPSYVEVHTNEGNRDHTFFWARYHELRSESLIF